MSTSIAITTKKRSSPSDVPIMTDVVMIGGNQLSIYYERMIVER